MISSLVPDCICLDFTIQAGFGGLGSDFPSRYCIVRGSDDVCHFILLIEPGIATVPLGRLAECHRAGSLDASGWVRPR